jgi:hypothetical protein
MKTDRSLRQFAKTRWVAWLSVLVLSSLPALAAPQDEKAWEWAVQLQAAVNTAGATPTITLSWRASQATSPAYSIFRKDDSGTWINMQSTITANTWTDNSPQLAVNRAYEYKVVKTANSGAIQGYGYIYVGVNAPLVKRPVGDTTPWQHQHRRGKLILIVDNRFTAPLHMELTRLEHDLVGDGWEVLRYDVPPTERAQDVRALIRGAYNTYQSSPNDYERVKSVFLFGNIPVRYSGDKAWDGHESIENADNHRGAWGCDGYYGEMDLSEAAWGDCLRDTEATLLPNRNVGGDGKFDANTFPSNIELQVGRVDLHGVDALSSPLTSEQELLRRYLNRNHDFRIRTWTASRTGLMGDGFGRALIPETGLSEAFAASGWRNMSALFGLGTITVAPTEHSSATVPDNSQRWVTKLRAGVSATTPYLWAYGCGAGDASLTYGELGTHPGHRLWTEDLALGGADNAKAVFYSFFGSYAGDWDMPKAIMRSALVAGYGLACSWSGRPHHYFHHMGAGETIGYGILLSQNNTGTEDGYQNQANDGLRAIHISLMGDPTLRLHQLQPPQNPGGTVGSSTDNVTWGAATQETGSPNFLGYYVYLARTPRGPFERLTPAPVLSPYPNPIPSGVTKRTYMIRTVRREAPALGSGSYTNLSPGAYVTLGTSSPFAPELVSVTNHVAAAREPFPDELEGSQICTFRIFRTNAPATSILVYFNLSGSAEPGQDYIMPSGPAAIGPGALWADVSIAIRKDELFETNETITLTLVPPADSLTTRLGTRTSATATINSFATLLPARHDHDLASARGLSQAGTPVGLSTLGPLTWFPNRAARWDLPAQQSWAAIKPVEVTIPEFEVDEDINYFTSFAGPYAINMGYNNRVIGIGIDTEGWYSAWWKTTTDIGRFPVWHEELTSYCNVYGMNKATDDNLLRVVGWSDSGGGIHGAYWHFEYGIPQGPLDLGAPGTHPHSFAYAINDPDVSAPNDFPHICGEAIESLYANSIKPLIWSKVFTFGILPLSTPQLTYTHGTTRDLNDQGIICGYVWNVGSKPRAARWKYLGGGAYHMLELPIPAVANIETYPMSINKVGTIVGYAYDPAFGNRAVLWRNDVNNDSYTFHFVREWFGDDPEIQFLNAYRINDNGQIAGDFLDGCSQKGFLLSP